MRPIVITVFLILSSIALGKDVSGAWVDMYGYGYSGEAVQFNEGKFKFWSFNDFGGPSCEPCYGTYRELENSIYLSFHGANRKSAELQLYRVIYDERMYLSNSENLEALPCWRNKKWYLFHLDIDFDESAPFRYRRKFIEENSKL